MKVEKYDFRSLDTITLRSDFAKTLNEYIDELKVNYNAFCLQRDNCMDVSVELSELMVTFHAVVEICTFLARCNLLKRKAYDRIIEFTDVVCYEVEQYRIIYGGN